MDIANRKEYTLGGIPSRVSPDMPWTVEFHAEFAIEFPRLAVDVQDEIFALAEKMRVIGPSMRRPASDTLKGSVHANMKELRFSAQGGAWRVAYAFDPRRRAIVLVAGDKSGVSQRRFYKTLIAVADARFTSHLRALDEE